MKKNIMINIKKLKNKKLFFPLFFILFSFFYFYPMYSLHEFSYDSLRFFSIDKVQNVFSFDYIGHMFLKGTNGPQYRPLSFFIYQLYTKALFGNHIWMYVALGVAYLLISTFLLFKILKLHGINKFFSYLGSFLFLIHPIHMTLLGNAVIPKYLLTVLILLIGVYYCSRAKRLMYRDVILLTFLQAISIMLHEGSITFSTIWFLTLLHRLLIKDVLNKYKKTWMFFIPSLVYILMRTTVHSIPSEGFMKVGLGNILTNLAYYFDSAFSMTFSMIFSLKLLTFPLSEHLYIGKTIFFIFVVLIGLFISCFKKRHDVSFFLLCIIIVISPFSLLSDHIVFNRSAWAIPFVIILITHFFTFFYYNFKSKLRFLPIILLVGLLFHNSYINREISKMWNEYRDEIYSEFIRDINSELSAYKSKVGEIIKVRILSKEIPSITPIYFFSVLPAALVSRHIPTADQAILWLDHPEIMDKHIFIKGGTYYTIIGQDKNSILTLDLFNNEVRFTVKGLEKKIEDVKPTFSVYF